MAARAKAAGAANAAAGAASAAEAEAGGAEGQAGGPAGAVDADYDPFDTFLPSEAGGEAEGLHSPKLGCSPELPADTPTLAEDLSSSVSGAGISTPGADPASGIPPQLPPPLPPPPGETPHTVGHAASGEGDVQLVRLSPTEPMLMSEPASGSPARKDEPVIHTTIF